MHKLSPRSRRNIRIEDKIDYLIWKVDKMAVDEAKLFEALQAFATDLEAGIQAIKDKINSIPGVDLTAEFDALTNIQTEFDTAVKEITT